VRAGRRAIALDNRGHGASSKLYDPAAYHSAMMAEDVRALLDQLGLTRADVIGYSMGARITAFLALKHPDRVRAAVLGGLGIHLVEGVGLPDSIAMALEAPSLSDVTDPTAYLFRAFAEQTKSDLHALAACIRGSRETLSRAEVGHIAVPLRKNSPRLFRGRRPLSFPAGTTCWPSATGCLRPVCSDFSQSSRN
jgi:pimeloyl-ACP methyl ester carboxylesterase